jgi:hypothetical protein
MAGSVPPMRIAGGASSTVATRKRAAISTTGASPSARVRPAWTPADRPRSGGVRSALTAIPHSSQP